MPQSSKVLDELAEALQWAEAYLDVAERTPSTTAAAELIDNAAKQLMRAEDMISRLQAINSEREQRRQEREKYVLLK
jgi:hypothetical protein